ncbi:DUF1516 family protein [Bacillus sp. 03113]|uniref:DUF1516 family protein n=1 Tax=Bacillus sp. 03113 TaxID=2578211 RepID=UPI0011430610|nr:DUF1516 family protein [Bacillus sp. 03113]
MTHAHITTWVISLILFFVVLGLGKSGKEKGKKIVHMILRLFYLFIIATGVILLLSISSISFLYVLKSLVGLWIIAILEMILVRGGKKKQTSIFWVQFVIALLLVFYLGFKLPLGFLFF